jgi:ABC-type bacteriocin/lantibiotic exporter with double-glycine peptidase domain
MPKTPSTTQTAKMKPRNLLEHALEIVTLWYGGRLALRGQMDFGELSSAVLVAQNAFDGAR